MAHQKLCPQNSLSVRCRGRGGGACVFPETLPAQGFQMSIIIKNSLSGRSEIGGEGTVRANMGSLGFPGAPTGAEDPEM